MRVGPTAAATTTLVVGLNPALQKRIVLPAPLCPGQVHRVAEAPQWGMGGKGQDVICTLHHLQFAKAGRSATRIMQFLGSDAAGDVLLDQLKPMVVGYNDDTTTTDADDAWVSSLTQRTVSPLRTCTSIVAPDTTTELVEPSGAVSKEEVHALLHEKLPAVLQSSSSAGRIGAMAFMGSLPPNCPTDVYAQIYQQVVTATADVASEGCLTVVDSLVGLDALLDVILETNQNDNNKDSNKVVLKVNVDEMCQLTKTKKDDSEDAATTVSTAVQAFYKQHPAAQKALYAICLTNGAQPAYVAMSKKNDGDASSFSLTMVPVPNLSEQRNPHRDASTPTTLYPIGAGDAVAAGTLAAWQVLERSENNKDDDNNDRSSMLLPPKLTEALWQHYSQQQPQKPIVTAFAFGLACGSASCWQTENSVVDIDDVAYLFSLQQPKEQGAQTQQLA